MTLRSCIPILLALLSLPAQAALTTYNDAAGLIANGGKQIRYDFEIASGFPTGNYDPTLSLIGARDGIQFDAITIRPNLAPVSGSQAMSGADGVYSAARLDFSALSRPVIGFGFYGQDLTIGESIRVSADFRLAGQQIFDVRLDGAPELTPIYFGAYDANDAIRSLSFTGIDDSGNNRAWYIDDLSLISAAVPLPPALPLFLGGLLLLSRFRSKSAGR